MVFLCCSAGELVKTFELSSEEIALRCTMGSLNAEVTCARYNHNGASAVLGARLTTRQLTVY